MILYNGSTGSLGAYFREAADRKGHRAEALRSRLEAPAELRDELQAIVPEPRLGPAAFVQLAAMVSVPACERDPTGAHKTNVADTLTTAAQVCNWAHDRHLDLTMLYVSSCHVYASQPEGHAICESDPLSPRSVYAQTKLEAEQRLSELARREGRPLIIARVFGLVAARQPPHYVLPAMIQRVADERMVGIPGLSFFRDYLDARDVCEIIVDLATRAFSYPLFNICSGQPLRLRDMVERIARALKPARADMLLAEMTEAAARPDDVAWIVGDPTRTVTTLGRALRRVTLAQTVDDAIRARIQ